MLQGGFWRIAESSMETSPRKDARTEQWRQSNEQSDYQERRDASLSSRERGASLSERVASSEMESTNPVSPGPPPRHILASEHTSTSGDNKIVGLFSLKSPGQQRTIHQNSNIIDGPPSAFRTPILEREPRTPARNI